MADSLPTISPLRQDGASTAPSSARPRVLRTIAIVLILWLALFLRVWQLDVLPPGLHYDEAFNGTVARGVLRGTSRPIFFTGNFGEEPMHMYAEAGLFALVGESPWTIRLTSALFGVIFVAGVYACARAFFPRSDLTALTAAFIAATLYWAINFSRIGLETNSLPPILTLSAAAMAHAYRRMSWRWVVAAGVLLGLTIYTYLASRVWLVAVFLWFVYLVLFHRRAIQAHFSKWVLIGVFAALTLAPLILFFVANPVAFTGRAGTVFVPETFFTNLTRTAAMFSFSGDLDPRDNLQGRPALDIFLSLFFLVGVVVSLVRFRKPFYAFTLIWFVVMVMPSALTEFAPNFRRAIGALPATILLCGLGVEWLAEMASRRLQVTSRSPQVAGSRWVVPLLLIAALGTSAVWSARAYFVDWASGTGLYYSFDAGLLAVGRALAARPPNEDLYLSTKYDDHYTIIWALDGRHVSSFDGRQGLVTPNSSRASTYGIIVYEDSVTTDALSKHGVETNPLLSLSDAAGGLYAKILSVNAVKQPATLPVARVGEFGWLQSAVVSPRALKQGDKIEITAEWMALHGAAEDYTVSAQLIGPPNPATGSPLWAQDDKQPLGGTYPTRGWQSGQTIFDPYALQIPQTAPPGHYELRVSMYLLETGMRVPFYKSDGTPFSGDAATIKTFDLK